MPKLISLAMMVLLVACTKLPSGVEAVQGFDKTKYLGKWYEIARLDQRFEAGLSQVTAEYSLRDDGGIQVVNRGYSAADGEWREAEGRAYFVGEESTAHLKVSFFGPFYSSYVAFELGYDEENSQSEKYQYAFVSGYNKSYLWLLARTPMVSDELISRFVNKARSLGFDTGSLLYVKHPKPLVEN
ncbi:MAG: lipocalin family protein [Zhongshania sp.]|uniref:lipocalin family protein n=1 Tax=Zhongshania sp. TaxID=1971902 RepID=UPI002636D579|nr:lipocalin family protein [Zhongshania sp.]MDF1690724.1 lipocalin family protein [Zhongshania sp.]